MVSEKKKYMIIALGIISIALISRGPITGVGSVIDFIKEDLAISNGVAGFITTIPLLIFAVLSPFISGMSKKIGMGRFMMYGLIMIIFGVLLRSYGHTTGLFLGTAIIGMGIAVANVLIPSIIKLKFPYKIGLITGLYTTFMGVASSLAAGFSAPLADNYGLGWENTLALWALIAFLVLVVWLPQCGNQKDWGKVAKVEKKSKIGNKIFKSPLAWAVAFFMGLQSILFYAFVAWLPTIVVFKGYSLETAGYYALLYQVICMPASFITPIFCDKYKDQRIITLVFAIIYLIGMTAFLFAESAVPLAIAIILCGIGSGAAISLAMAFMALRAADSAQASSLSGMSQSIGYLLAAPATTIMGCIFDLTQTWTVPILLLIIVTFIWLLVGTRAARDKKIFD